MRVLITAALLLATSACTDPAPTGNATGSDPCAVENRQQPSFCDEYPDGTKK